MIIIIIIKKEVVAIKGPVCAVLMSAMTVRRDPPSAGGNAANLGRRCKLQKIGGRWAKTEEKAEQKVTDGQAERVPHRGGGNDSWCSGDSAANCSW